MDEQRGTTGGERVHWGGDHTRAVWETCQGTTVLQIVFQAKDERQGGHWRCDEGGISWEKEKKRKEYEQVFRCGKAGVALGFMLYL